MKKLSLFLLAFALFVPAPLRAQNAPPPAEKETLQNVGSAFWRIGAPSASNGFYIEAPANLGAGGVTWDKLPPTVFSRYSAQNEQICVELVRGATRDFEPIHEAIRGVIGVEKGTGKATEIASYPARRAEKDGKIGLLVTYGPDVWAIAITPQNPTPAARAVAQKSAESLWFERREAPAWKDRAIGTTSLQADLPFDLAPRGAEIADTVRTSARWRNFWVDATEWRSGRTDLEGTVALQIENFQKSPGLENIRVKTVDRPQKWGFLDGAERGKFVQIDFLEAKQPRRIYKLFSVAGTRVVQLTLTLNANDSLHQLAAKRILGTARLGWTTLGKLGPVTLPQNGATLDFFHNLQAGGDENLRVYKGSDPRNAVIVFKSDRPNKPAQTGELATGLSQMVLNGIAQGAGATLDKSRVDALPGPIFPTRRVIFELKNGNQRLSGDSAILITSGFLCLFVDGQLTVSYVLTQLHAGGKAASYHLSKMCRDANKQHFK